MRKSYILLSIILVLNLILAGTPDAYGAGKMQLGLQANGNYYLSFLDDDDAEGKFGPGFGGFINYGVTRHFSLNLDLEYNQVNIDYANELKNNILLGLLKARFHLFRGKMVNPFYNFGLGIFNYSQDNGYFSGTHTAGMFNMGIGAEIPVSKKVNLIPSINLNSTIQEDIDLPPNSKDILDDQYLNFSLGFAYTLGGPKKEKTAYKPEPKKVKKVEEEEKAVPQDSLQRLKSKIEQKEKNLEEYKNMKEEYSRKINALISLIEEKNTTIDSLRKTQEKGKAEPDKERTKQEKDADKLYNESLQLFHQKEYKEAARNFKSLLNDHPEHKLASNFAYWTGESYYGMESYEVALDYFERVQEDYPDSPKNDDALIMAGQALLKLGRVEEAKDKFRDLLNNYPDSEYSKLAENYLNR